MFISAYNKYKKRFYLLYKIKYIFSHDKIIKYTNKPTYNKHNYYISAHIEPILIGPIDKSIFENWTPFCKKLNKSYILDIGYLTTSKRGFNVTLKSLQIRTLALLFNTGKMGVPDSLVATGEMIPLTLNYLALVLHFLLRHMV